MMRAVRCSCFPEVQHFHPPGLIFRVGWNVPLIAEHFRHLAYFNPLLTPDHSAFRLRSDGKSPTCRSADERISIHSIAIVRRSKPGLERNASLAMARKTSDSSVPGHSLDEPYPCQSLCESSCTRDHRKCSLRVLNRWPAQAHHRSRRKALRVGRKRVPTHR